ncbi:hypothetical protein [Pedobacter frigiditerrae]|uniref:hypothetical protein n=1 Tax=Pedobacter frigiditerrae TaxID=2530452 RepID=UPI002930A1A7|nr:hypothetical protein [Pedobacter frigiditerrae]
MKLKYLFISCLALFFSCNSDSNKIKLNADSLKIENVEAKFLIVPGKSIGKFHLGQNVVELDSILGKPDFSDAAMGKAWSIWYRGDTSKFRKQEIAVFSSYADSTMKWKDVKQIRVNSNKVTTVTGLNNGNLLSSFTAKYSDFKKVATFVNDNLGDTILLYDSKSNGIAAEFIRDISRAIIIHKKGEMVNETYLTLHPEWKILK